MLMMVLTYVLSDKAIDFILTIDVIVLKRVLNLILATILVFVALNKNTKEQGVNFMKEVQTIIICKAKDLVEKLKEEYEKKKE